LTRQSKEIEGLIFKHNRDVEILIEIIRLNAA